MSLEQHTYPLPQYAGPLEKYREKYNVNDWATIVLHAAESYEHKTLVDNPALLDRALMNYEPEAAAEVRARIARVFDLSERVTGACKPLPPDDDSALRNLLLFAWPESGTVAFMGVTNAELLRHRSVLCALWEPVALALVLGHERPGCGHLWMFDNHKAARRAVEHLYTFYAHRDARAWPVWGLSPTGNYWSVNGRSFGEAFRTD